MTRRKAVGVLGDPLVDHVLCSSVLRNGLQRAKAAGHIQASQYRAPLSTVGIDAVDRGRETCLVLPRPVLDADVKTRAVVDKIVVGPLRFVEAPFLNQECERASAPLPDRLTGIAPSAHLTSAGPPTNGHRPRTSSSMRGISSPTTASGDVPTSITDALEELLVRRLPTQEA